MRACLCSAPHFFISDSLQCNSCFHSVTSQPRSPACIRLWQRKAVRTANNLWINIKRNKLPFKDQRPCVRLNRLYIESFVTLFDDGEKRWAWRSKTTQNIGWVWRAGNQNQFLGRLTGRRFSLEACWMEDALQTRHKRSKHRRGDKIQKNLRQNLKHFPSRDLFGELNKVFFWFHIRLSNFIHE